MAVTEIDPTSRDSDFGQGWMFVWAGRDDPLLDTLDDLADRLSQLGITVEMSNDDDWGKIRLIKDGKPLLRPAVQPKTVDK